MRLRRCPPPASSLSPFLFARSRPAAAHTFRRLRRWTSAALIASGLASGAFASATFPWPEMSAETKPWTRWWWPGSAVTPADLTADLEEIARVGIGGVELTPVYGAKGYEERYLRYLSPAWLDAYDHTRRETQRLGLGLDLANGTGWNAGGPTVGERDAPKHVVFRRFTLRGGQRLNEPVVAEQRPWVNYVLGQVYGVGRDASRAADATAKAEPPATPPATLSLRPGPTVEELRDPLEANTNLQQLAIDQIKYRRALPLQALLAYGPNEEIQDLTKQVQPDGALDWTAPAGEWTLYAVFQAPTGKLVERAGPGGEGYMVDHLSREAVSRYFAHLAQGFDARGFDGVRAFFSDSYEVDDARQPADWTEDFLTEFERRRGYDLRGHLPALFAENRDENQVRILSDFRETVSDLLLDGFTRTWSGWAHERNLQIRNQSHGSPANLLDLYAASDIPETEGILPPNMRFASSAAHVAGRRLVGAEAVTFLNENFLSTPAQIRENLRRYWLNGVNHVVYHGTAFTPQDEAWPGWFFYVAVHLNPRNPLWAHTSAVHHYATRVQSFLQAGRPDNDVLLYFPVHDLYAEPPERPIRGHEGDGPARALTQHLTTGGDWLQKTAFGKLADQLLQRGYAIDYVSDRQLQQLTNADGQLLASGNRYQLILVPPVRFVPLSTLQWLFTLAEQGATVAFVDQLPGDVAGWAQFVEKREQLRRLTESLRFAAADRSGVKEARLGSGRILVGAEPEALLGASRVRRESMHDQGLQTIRRKLDDSTAYYVVHSGRAAVNGWIPLASPAESVAIYDPVTGRSGRAATRQVNGTTEVYLQLEPDDSCLLRLYPNKRDGEAFPLWQPAGPALPLEATWQLSFLSGGPHLPAAATLDRLGSWTELDGADYDAFSGTARYQTRFPRPATDNAEGWWLDLGEVEETAEVILNGTLLGITIGPRHRVFVPASLWRDQNELDIRVANLGANRIADLDRRDPSWKKLYNQNIRPLRSSNRGPDGMFTAAHWEPMASGLLGPVKLVPLRALSTP